MHFTECDVEFIILIFSLILLFCLSLKNRMMKSSKGFLEIDLDMSFMMKGIACILILMGHYVNLTSSIVEHGSLSKYIYLTSANIGLVWFMFFSGYGISLKSNRGG